MRDLLLLSNTPTHTTLTFACPCFPDLLLSVALILASQTTGGAIGSLFAPAKVIVGASTVEGAIEGQVLKRAIGYGLLILSILGILVLILSLSIV